MKEKNKFVKFILPFFIFSAGIFLCIYPYISDLYYTTKTDEQVSDFVKKSKTIDKVVLDKKIKEAQVYNYALDPYLIHDPYTKEEKENSISKYAKMLEVEEKIGFIDIPIIDINLPIYAGTSEHILQKGVGHMEGSSLPVGGENTHTVLTAHTGLPRVKLFSDLDKLKVGDKFYIHNIRDTLAYQVDQIKVVEPNDFKYIKIIPKKDYATLLTCTPYMINTHRLLVRGHRIPYVEQNYQNEKKTTINTDILKLILFVILLILIIILMYLNKNRKLRKINKL